MECVSTVALDPIDDLASSSLDELLSMRMRFIECEAHIFATARPTPEAAPVIKALAPLRKTFVGADIVWCDNTVLVFFSKGKSGRGALRGK